MCAIESAFGPLIVMIDASRLSHSLATALKDRPHGIPVQPNRSLPLRPPPPLPIRVPVSKSPKTSPTTQSPVTHNAARRSSCTADTSPDEELTKKGKVRDEEDRPSLEVVGMNFYDSKGEEEFVNANNETETDNLSPIISKGISKLRHTKSLDNYGSDESNCSGEKRRKSSDYDEISRDFETKKRSFSNFEWVGAESVGKIDKRNKERRGKKRKSLSTEEDHDLSGKPKYHRVVNSDGQIPVRKFKPVPQAEAKVPKFRVESSGMDLPTIYKYRKSGSSTPRLVGKNRRAKTLDDRSSWKRTSPNTYKLILPKPAKIPKCPDAIPIELAHAMNQGDLKNSNNSLSNGGDFAMSQTGNFTPAMSESNSKTPKNTNASESLEDNETILPSMPSLEDMMLNESLIQEKLATLSGNRTDVEKSEANLGMKSVPMVEARVLHISEDFLNKTSSLDHEEKISQGNTNVTNDLELNKPHESIVNLTTVLEIQISQHFSEVPPPLEAPQIVASSKEADSVANNSSVEANTSVSLAASIQQTLEEPRTIKEPKNIETLNGLRGYRKDNQHVYRTSQEKVVQDNEDKNLSTKLSPSNDHEELSEKDQPQYTLQSKSPVEFVAGIGETAGSSQRQESEQQIAEESQVKQKVENILRYRKNKANLKLQKLYEEEAHIRYKMSRTSDPSRLTRLQQRMNCAKKRIENTQKQLSKLVSIETPGSCANHAPSRIQVRRDLVQKIPSPGSLESGPQSPPRPTSETDEASTGRSSPVTPPVVITISETESASSDEETDTNYQKSPDNIKPCIQFDQDMKFNYECVTQNDTKVACVPGNPSPDDKAENVQLKASPEMTNNNVEYFNKNLAPVREAVYVNANSPPTGSPEIFASQNTAPLSIPGVPTSLNTSISIPRVPTSTNTASINIPPLIHDSIDHSLNKLTDFVRQKSPGSQYGVTNLNLPPDKVDRERGKDNCNCAACLRGATVVTAKNTTQFETNKYITNAANDLRTPSTLRRTAIQENTNVNPVPNYPVHQNDYRTTGNGPSMFSRDNGGANINLSSPLQGHSALPLPPAYYRNLTAQGYPVSAEPSQNQQTSQWHSQQPPIKSSVPFTPEQDLLPHSSILASHLLGSHAQDSANLPSSIKSSSPAQGKDATRNNPPNHISERIMSAQFPTLASWASQIIGESNTARIPQISTSADRTGYKTTGSDMYKMAATAIDPIHPQSAVNNSGHWTPGRPCSATEQPRPTQGYPSQRNVPPQSHRRDYPKNPQISQNPAKSSAAYPGSEVFVTHPANLYHQVPSGAQNTRSNKRSSSLPSYNQQNARQYQAPPSATRPLAPGNTYQKNSQPFMNPMGFMPQQYVQRPPSYVQAMNMQWQAGNYHNPYVGSQYSNGYNLQAKPMEQNSTLYRTAGKNFVPMQSQPQPQPQHNPAAARHLSQNVLDSMYNMGGNLNPGIVVPDGRNGEVFDVGRLYHTPQLSNDHKGVVDRLNILQCSRCGRPGPKFNCFGCENAFYCDKQCQVQHWNTHFIECSKKMPKLKKVS